MNRVQVVVLYRKFCPKCRKSGIDQETRINFDWQMRSSLFISFANFKLATSLLVTLAKNFWVAKSPKFVNNTRLDSQFALSKNSIFQN